jgi:hypothetical protein
MLGNGRCLFRFVGMGEGVFTFHCSILFLCDYGYDLVIDLRIGWVS